VGRIGLSYVKLFVAVLASSVVKRLGVLVAVGVLGLSGSAEAVRMEPAHGNARLVTPDGLIAQPYQRWADAAKMPTPLGQVTVYDEPCPTGHWACYYRDGRRIYLDPVRMRPLIAAQDHATRLQARIFFFHELFHDFDETGVLTDVDRAEFERIMHLTGAWRIADHDHSPNETFADGAAACAVRPTISEWDTEVVGGSYQPTPRQHRRVCALIRRAGRAR
jgi:hypothetical protein